MNPTIKNILIGIGVVGVLLISYFFLFKKDKEEAILSSSGDINSIEGSSSVVSSEASKDFISLLLSVRSIKLDDAILNDKAFLSLKDTTITIIQNEDEGRPNPFAKIGAESIIPAQNPSQVPKDKINSTKEKNTQNKNSSSDTNTSLPPDTNLLQETTPDLVVEQPTENTNTNTEENLNLMPENNLDINPYVMIDPFTIGEGNTSQ